MGTVRVRITLVATAVVAVALIAGSFVLVSMLSSRLTEILGTEGHRRLKALLTKLLEVGGGG